MFARLAVTLVFLVLVCWQPVKPSFALAWNWSFGSDAGMFLTDGDSAAPGWFSVEDFIVTQSSVGGSLGSWSGGQYTPRGFWTEPPYRILWDGNAVVRWDSGGMNTFDWLVFKDSFVMGYFYLFGWESGNRNVMSKASHYMDGNQTSWAVSVYPEIVLAYSRAETETAPVPEPTTILLLGIGLVGISAFRRYNRGEK